MANNEQGRLNIQIGIDNTKLAQDALESQRIINGIGSTAVEEGAAIDSAMKKVGMAIGGVFTMQQALSFASQVISVRKEIESLEVSFRTLLGSKQQADQLLGQIREFAVNTPMQLNDLARGAQTLLSFNYEADKVMRTLQALGDISMGDSAKFNSLTLAFAQMSSTGKLMGQDLMQMINAGFNPLSVISEQTGKSIGDLKDEMSKGAISSKMVEDAFIAATSAGGKFYGMLEAQSQTIGGSISNLQGAIDDMFNAIGESTQGIVTDALSVLTSLAKNYKAVGEAIAMLIAMYGTYKAAVIATTLVTRALELAEIHKNLAAKEGVVISTAQALRYIIQTKAAAAATSATAALNATLLANPYALAAAAAVALGYGIYKLATYETEADKQMKELNETLKNQEEQLAELNKERNVTETMHEAATKSIAAEITKVEDLQAAISDETASVRDRRKAISELQAIVPGYQATLSDEGVLYVNNTNAVNDYITSLQNLAIAKALQSKREEITAQRLAAELERREAVKKQKEAQKQAEDARKNADQQRKAAKEANDAAIEAQVNMSIGGKEAMVMQVAQGASYKTEVNNINKQEQLAEKKLQKAKNDVAILDQKIKNANDELKTLDDYQRENNIKPVKAEQTTTTGTGGGKGGRGNNNAAAEAERLQQEAQERQKALNEYKVKLAEQDKQADFELRQKRIDLSEESANKEIEQIQLNYDRMLYENEKRRQQMYDELAEKKIIEYMDANPKAKQTEVNDYASTLIFTDADLTEAQQNTLKAYQELADKYLVKANQDALSNVLNDVLTYEQQRTKITEEYTKKRAALIDVDADGNETLKKGVKQENIDELNRQQEEALKAIDEQFAQREVDYQAWCDAIGELSLKQLTDLLDKAKQELAKLKGEGVKDERLAVAEAKVNTLTDKVNKANATDKLAPKKRTIKEWQDLYSTLNECASAFNDIGDAVGDTAGEAIKAAGQMATSTLSIINGIMTLANSSGNAIQGVSTAASKAISTVEKASVILTIVSTALQIAMAIANLFNDDAQKQEEIDRLQARIDQLQWELDNTDIMQMQAQYGTSVERTLKHIQEARQAMIDTAEATGNWYEKMIAYNTQISKSTTMLQKAVKAMADEYEKMSYTADKALGEAKYNSYYDYLKNISEQQILIQEQIDQEASKKDTDDDKIKEWKQKIEELGQQALSLVNDLVEEIIGGSAEDIAERLSDAFFDAFENGEEAAKAWGDEVKKIVGDIVKQMMIKQVLETEIGKIFDKYKAMWFNDGKFVGAEAVRQSMDAFMSDLNNTYDTFSQLWDALPEELKTLLTGDSEREGASRGIASASQDSIDELNARATTIQSHTYSISENTKLLVSNTNAILNSVLAIEAHTESLTKQMSAVESELYRVRTSVDDFTTKGIKIK